MTRSPFLTSVLLLLSACAGRGEAPSPAVDFSTTTEDDAAAEGHAVPDALPSITVEGASAPDVAEGELRVTGWFVAPCLGLRPGGVLAVDADGTIRLDVTAKGEGPCATVIEQWRWTAVVTGLEPGMHDVRVSYDPAVSVAADADGIVFQGNAEVR